MTDMTGLRSRISAALPKAIKPTASRTARRLSQIWGQRRAHQRPGTVVMLHVGRCGSTVLANLLKQDPAIHWDAKLHRKALEMYGDRLRDLDHAAWLKRQFSISGDRYYGFEFKILQDQYPVMAGLTLETFLTQCQAIGVTHYVLLVRRNTLRHVISHYVSRNRGNWHFGTGDKAQAQRFVLDLDDITTGSAPGRGLVEYLREVETAHDDARRLLAGEQLLEVEYETDIDKQGAAYAYEKICGFLGTPPVPVEILNRKANPFPMRDTLTNYDALVARLEGTEFAWMLDDPAEVPQ